MASTFRHSPVAAANNAAAMARPSAASQAYAVAYGHATHQSSLAQNQHRLPLDEADGAAPFRSLFSFRDDYYLEEVRRQTFELWPPWAPRTIGIDEMVKAGMYFTGDMDIVRCFSCKKCFSDWRDGQDPLQIHRRRYPECEFIKNLITTTGTTTAAVVRRASPTTTTAGATGAAPIFDADRVSSAWAETATQQQQLGLQHMLGQQLLPMHQQQQTVQQVQQQQQQAVQQVQSIATRLETIRVTEQRENRTTLENQDHNNVVTVEERQDDNHVVTTLEQHGNATTDEQFSIAGIPSHRHTHALDRNQVRNQVRSEDRNHVRSGDALRSEQVIRGTGHNADSQLPAARRDIEPDDDDDNDDDVQEDGGSGSETDNAELDGDDEEDDEEEDVDDYAAAAGGEVAAAAVSDPPRIQRRSLAAAVRPDKSLLRAENERLRRTVTCKKCNREKVQTLFLPCKHLVSCEACADTMDTCIVCAEQILGTVKIFFL